MALEPGVIRRLDEVVVNRIAAGEVIQVGQLFSVLFMKVIMRDELRALTSSEILMVFYKRKETLGSILVLTFIQS